MSSEHLKQLWLLQLSDSALPIGAMAHSFGLETLIAEEVLDVEQLESFLRGYLSEAGVLESVFCRSAYRLATDEAIPMRNWLILNNQLSAFKLARESRIASATLGRRFLMLIGELSQKPLLRNCSKIT